MVRKTFEWWSSGAVETNQEYLDGAVTSVPSPGGRRCFIRGLTSNIPSLCARTCDAWGGRATGTGAEGGRAAVVADGSSRSVRAGGLCQVIFERAFVGCEFVGNIF